MGAGWTVSFQLRAAQETALEVRSEAQRVRSEWEPNSGSRARVAALKISNLVGVSLTLRTNFGEIS